MKLKKNPKVSLEKYRMVFFEIGLMIALFVVYLVLESKSTRNNDFELTSTRTVFVDDVVVPQTERKREKLIKPKIPPPPVTQIVVIANDIEIEEELNIETTEIDEDTEIEFIKRETKPIYQEEEEEEVYNFQIVESQPIFPGCEGISSKQARYLCFQKMIMSHVKKNFKYPETAKEMGIQGRVIVKFVISKDGEISNISVLRGIDRNLDNEALRIVSKIPSMQPAKQRGRPVPVSFMLPITFKLQ